MTGEAVSNFWSPGVRRRPQRVPSAGSWGRLAAAAASAAAADAAAAAAAVVAAAGVCRQGGSF